MADKILNFEEESQRMNEQIKEIDLDTDHINKVIRMRSEYIKLKSHLIFSIIAGAFVLFALITGFLPFHWGVRVLLVIIGIIATIIIFQKEHGKLAAVTIALATISYFIVFPIFLGEGMTVLMLILQIPLLLAVAGVVYTLMINASFKKRVGEIIKR